MPIALRSGDYEDYGFFPSESTIERVARFTPSRIIERTIGACFDLVERSTISEPHFIWEDLNSVVLSPSAYQFTQFQDISYELVTIDEEDIPLRDFCIAALDTLEAYQELEDGWDDDGAPAPSDGSLADAYLILRLISSELEKCPDIVPMLDYEGIPSFAFDTAKKYISIAFYGDGNLVTYTIDRESNKSSAKTFVLQDVEDLGAFLSSLRSL